MVPQVLSLVLHGVGGYLMAMVADELGHPEAGVPVAAVVGVAKEMTDLNFNVPDAIFWPLGAGLYELQKGKGWCWKDERPWYFDQAGAPCKDSP